MTKYGRKGETKRIGLFVLSVLLVAVLIGSCFARYTEEFDPCFFKRGIIELGPGEHYALYYDVETGEMMAKELPRARLPPEAYIAIARAPLWIREKLRKAFEDLTKRDICVSGNSKPCLGDLNGDGLNDLVVGSKDGVLTYYENTGAMGFPQWTRKDRVFFGIRVYNFSAPSLADLNGDGLLDLAVGCGDGKIYFWWNFGTKTQRNGVAITQCLPI